MRGFALSAWMILGLLQAGSAQAAENTPSGAGVRHVSTRAMPRTPENHVVLGVYDPHRALADEHRFGIEHVFLYWQATDRDKLRAHLDQAARRGRAVMATVEPYTRAANWRDGGETLFADIVAGKFAPEIASICGELGRHDGPVLVRWGHEMEDATGRYPWARADHEGYKAAYRSFVSACRAFAPQARFVWSPKGDANAAEYYPGDAWVDFVGVSLWGLEKFDRDYFGGPRYFEAAFGEKYRRAAAYGKSVIIAELGVSGRRAYRDKWFRSLFDAARRSDEFPHLRAVVFFNDKEPYHWPSGYGSPDWRIDASLLRTNDEVASNPGATP